MRRTIFLACLLALAACAGDPQWSKTGVSPQMAAADLAECNSMVQADFRRDDNIDADILASRRHDWEQTGTLSTRQAVLSTQNVKQSQDLVKACMISKGYAPGA
jgi:hypothetical protein